MQLKENIWLLSTYQPEFLGSTEIEILSYFANNKSASAYDVWKEFQQNLWKKEISYKNIHKRVKRLVNIDLIKEIKEHHFRRAIHYKITLFGIISYLDKSIISDYNFIEYNKDNIIIQLLLLDFFEEKSIKSIYDSTEFPSNNISIYLMDCSSTITRQCRNIWNKINKYELNDTLPESETIHQYLSYIDFGKYTDDAFLQQIYLYKTRLKEKLKVIKDQKLLKKWDFDNKWYSIYIKKNLRPQEIPVFPLNVLYVEILWLKLDLENKKKLLTFNLVSKIGGIKDSQKRKIKKEINLFRLETEKYQYILALLKDKKFIQSVKEIKQNFDLGYKQFNV